MPAILIDHGSNWIRRSLFIVCTLFFSPFLTSARCLGQIIIIMCYQTVQVKFFFEWKNEKHIQTKHSRDGWYTQYICMWIRCISDRKELTIKRKHREQKKKKFSTCSTQSYLFHIDIHFFCSFTWKLFISLYFSSTWMFFPLLRSLLYMDMDKAKTQPFDGFLVPMYVEISILHWLAFQLEYTFIIRRSTSII